jgi:hypothetical protein
MVVSCDAYADLWSAFFSLFRRFWPDCPYTVYLLSNHKTSNFPGVTPLTIGDDISWSDNIKTGLKRIPEQYVLMFIDDLFLLKPVDAEAVNRTCKKFITVDGNYLRLNPSIKADAPFNEYFGVVSPGSIYRTSTVLSLWKKSVLLELLRAGESAWDFEIYGTIRSDAHDGFYSTHENIFPVLNTVIKGKWQRKTIAKMRALGVPVDLKKRGTLTITETMLFMVKQIRSKILNFLPAKYRRGIKEFLLQGKYDYKIRI